MSSNIADPNKFQEEMFLKSNFKNILSHDDVITYPIAKRMTEILCYNLKKCENNITYVPRNNILSQKVDINWMQDNPCDTTEFSETIKYSSDICLVNHCMLSEDVNVNCNCNIMHYQQHKQISQNYMYSIYNLWRIRTNKSLPLLITNRVGTQWRNCFWRIFLIPFIILLLCTTICSADPNQCAVGLTTPSDKASKPYVQTGLIDPLKKPFSLSNIDCTRSTTMSTPFAATSLTDSCNKPFVSSFVSPTTTLASTLDTSSKPYVSVSSISEVSKKPNLQTVTLESSQKTNVPQTSTTDGSQPYVRASSVFQMLQQQQRGKSDTPISEVIDETEEDVTTVYPLCWQTSGTKPSSKLDADKSIITTKQSTGYVTIAENPKLDQHRTSTLSSSYVQHERFEKPLPQSTGQSDEQYSKVTVVPSTIQ